jgi:hypothetical protein
MRRALAVTAAAFAVAAAGCMAHGAQTPPPAAASQAVGAPAGMSMQNCPMAVPGTQVSVADTPDGEAITFTTSPDHASDLRDRVHAMADMHNRHHQGDGMEGMHGVMQHGHMMGGGEHMTMMPPPSRAAVEDVDGGARIVVSPTDPADVDRLRSAVRAHAEHMRESGTCEMGHGGSH